MLVIRAIGAVAGALGVLLLLRLFGQRRISRITFVLFSIISGGLIVISVTPDALNIAGELLFPGQAHFYRIITLLVVSNFLVWPLMLWERMKAFRRGQQINSIIKKFGVEDFVQRYPTLRAFKSILVIIPAFNEEKNIGPVLAQIPSEIEGWGVDVLVVDDGSTDGTRQASQQAEAYVARNLINAGGGLALQLGFELAMRGGAKIVVTLDADGQHMPEEMQQLVTPLIKDEADIIIGSRLKGEREKDSVIRYVGIHFFNRLINLIAGTSISDCSNSYRSIKTEALKILKLLQEQYHTSELIIEASKQGLRMKEVPITVLKRKHGVSKKGKSLRYGFNFTKAIFKTWWR